MAENTSIGSVQLDVEIKQDSLNIEINKLGKVINSSFKNMFNGFIGQTNNFVKDSFGRMGRGFKSFAQSGADSNEKVSKSINKMNAEYEKTQQKVNEIRNELAKLFAEQDAIIRSYQDMPALSGMTKDESMEHLLKSNPRYNELSEQIDKLTGKMNSFLEKNKILEEELKKVGNYAQDTGNKLRIMKKNTQDAGRDVDRTRIKTKQFGDEMKKSGARVAGFAAMINRSFRTILRRVFVYSLILKGIRGLISYTGAALKTNKQFVQSLNILKTNLRVAFQPIYDNILPALNTLMQAIARVTTFIATAISSLFGKTYKQSFNAAKSLDNAKKSLVGYGKTAKKVQGQLASFDEINLLQAGDSNLDGAGNDEFEMVMPDTSTIDLSGLERFKELLQPTIDSLKNLKLALEPLKDFTVKGLKDLYNNFLVPVGKWTFGEGLPRFIDALANGLMAINWQPINDGLNKLWEALTPFAINVGEGLLWFWENVLVPLGTWTMNEVVPIFLDILGEAIDGLNKIIEVLKPLGSWLWENFLKPLAEWTGGAIVDILNGIAYAFSEIADYIDGIQDVIASSDSFLDALVNVGVYLVEGLFNGIISALSSIGSWLKENLVVPIVSGVKKLFGIESPSTVFMEIGEDLILGLYEGIQNTWIQIIEFFIEKFDNLKTLFSDTWNSIKETASEIWNNLKESVTEIWTLISEFISNAWDIIREKTSEIWDNIKSFLIDKIWNPIKTVAKTIWEGIKKAILEPINQAWTSLIQIWDNLKKYILDKWNEIRQGIADMKDKLVNAIKEPFNIAKDWIGNIIKDARNWGRNLISNFVDGIKSMVGKVKDAVSGVVSGVKDFLGFSSPTKKGPGKDADKWMPNLMQMLADGIEDNLYEVSAAVNLTAGTINQGIKPNTDDMASAVGSAVLQSMQMVGNHQGQESGDIILQIDGITVGRILGPIMDREKERIGEPVINPI